MQIVCRHHSINKIVNGNPLVVVVSYLLIYYDIVYLFYRTPIICRSQNIINFMHEEENTMERRVGRENLGTQC